MDGDKNKDNFDPDANNHHNRHYMRKFIFKNRPSTENILVKRRDTNGRILIKNTEKKSRHLLIDLKEYQKYLKNFNGKILVSYSRCGF